MGKIICKEKKAKKLMVIQRKIGLSDSVTCHIITSRGLKFKRYMLQWISKCYSNLEVHSDIVQTSSPEF